jgi:hypothetical protein
MPYSTQVGKTILRALGASLIGILVSLALNHLLGSPTSPILAALFASINILAGSTLIIPWMLPEIKELLQI